MCFLYAATLKTPGKALHSHIIFRKVIISRYSAGYELRVVMDDQPLYEMASLDRSKLLGEYDLDTVAFCAKQNFQTRLKSAASKIYL